MPRLDQFLSSLGLCSRKDVAQWCRADRLRDGAGQPLRQADVKVDPGSVLLDGARIPHSSGLFILLHKPLGLVCSHDRREGDLVYDILPPHWYHRRPPVTSVGRLDKETSGAILITDQGHWVHDLTHPRKKVNKVYLATLDTEPDEELIDLFASGIQLHGEKAPCAPAALSLLPQRQARLVLTEGRYHQVRRMFAACGLTVTALHRESFGHYSVADLPVGQWRDVAAPDGRIFS